MPFFSFFPFIAFFLGLFFASLFILKIKKAPSGSGKMIEIQQAIKEGSIAFLKRQYKTIFLVSVFLFLILWYVLGLKVAFGFLIGAFLSGLCGFVGMMVSSQANAKVAHVAQKGLKPALNLAFKGGSVTGLLVASLGLLGVAGFYLLFQDLKALVALGFGGSLISVFARLGGGIYTKAADIGADLVGKVEKGIPEDDPRNPAVIADQVGDNVGDCAGMAADLFETYVVTLVAAMILGSLIFGGEKLAIFLPLILAAIALLGTLLAIFFVRLGRKEKIMPAFYKGLFASALISAIGFIFPIREFSEKVNLSFFNLYFSSLIGLLIVAGIFFITVYFTSKKYRPVKSIAKASQTGAATNIISGLSFGMKSTVLPIILISLGILISFYLSNLYGMALASLTMLSLVGMIIALDSYGPIVDNASGIVEMAGLSSKIREITDSLDAVGNTTKAVTKGYAIGSAGLAALVLFSAYTQELADLGAKIQFLLEDPKILVGLFGGGIVTFYFSSLALEAVGKAAAKVIEEVRDQFKKIKGLFEGKARPQYGKCVDIVTQAALKEMILPALLPVLFPILVGFFLGPAALGGLLIGSIVTGIFVAILMTSGGAAWDNAKKLIEEGELGGKGSFAHRSAVIGDMVGDPCKDTAGPAINPMIKVINVVALLIASFLI